MLDWQISNNTYKRKLILLGLAVTTVELKSRISPAKGDNKLPVDDQPRKNKSHLRTSNRIDSSSRLKRTVIHLHSDSICQTCNNCSTPFNHDLCVATCLQSAMATLSTRHNCDVKRKIKQVWKPKPVGKVWKPTGKVLTTIGHQWRPTGQILHLGKQFPLTREVAHQSDLVSHKFVTQSMTTTLSIEIRSLIEEEEKVEDKLIKQDQSLQTVHMLCRLRPNSNALNRVAIGCKNPLYLTHVKQVQPALYNGHEIIKDNHTPAIVHNSEDTLEIAEITRKKMNDKINDPECVTCKRITPTATTDEERGFEQTKACYLKEVIPFFKTLKDNFEGIQKALTKEVKEMKDVFKELEAEVAQYAIDRKHDAIELKNLLIANDNLIVECSSQEVFYVATNSELNVARFTGMHVANTTAETRCLALEDELANLWKRQRYLLFEKATFSVAQNDLFRAENDKIKQHYKELYDSIKITRAKHIKQLTKLIAKNVMLKTSVSKAKVQPPVSTRTKHAVDVESIVPRLRNNRDAHLDFLRHLKESVEIIHDIVEEAKVVRPLDRSIVSACLYTKHSQELLEKKQVTIAKPSDKSDSTTHRHVVTEKSNKLPVDDQPRKNKSHLRTSNRIDSSSRLKRT
nr:hypothetical protein [Tanacetum cinerariifolium]